MSTPRADDPGDYALIGHKGPNTSFGGFERWKLTLARTRPAQIRNMRATNRASLRKLQR